MASEFFDREAELSEGSEDEDVRNDIKSKKRSKFQDSDEEEEEDDEDRLRDEMKDLINDEEEEPEESDEEVTGRKRQRDEEDLEEDLEDDDYDLIEENLGRRIERKKKFRRVRRLEDDDEDEEKGDTQEVNDREAIANELFDNDEEVDRTPASVNRDRSDREAIDDRFAELSGSERSDDSDEDNFIVDDDDRPIAPRVRKKKSHRFTDEALQQAQDIFGVDFDFDEVQRFDESGDYEDGEEEELDEYEEGDQALNESQRSERSKKSSRKRRSARKSIFEIYEPSELERSHLTKQDNDIRNADIPERFQLRAVPVSACEEQELMEESDWVFSNAFATNTISIQDDSGEGKHEPIGGRKPPSAVPKIREALRFMRNESLEVPFITHYRKEYVEPELSVDDLWTVYKWDEKWCQLQTRKANLSKLFRNMQTYQTEQIMRDPDAPLPEGMRLINEVDIDRINSVKTFEELRDCWLHFQLYYSADVPDMKKDMVRKERQRRLDEVSAGGAEEDIEKTLAEEEEQMNAKLSSMKLAQRKDTYTICKEAGIIGLVTRFGLTPDQFGENLRDNYQRHEVEQYPVDPLEAAQDYICHRFPSVEKVLQAANFMVAKQISCDPIVRQTMRQTYFERAQLQARPTKKGIKEIDENHPCYSIKYLLNKPIASFGGDQFLQLMIAKDEGLMEFSITIDKLELQNSTQTTTTTNQTYFDEIRQLYHRDEFSINVQQWNAQRAGALEIALNKFLYPSFEKELKTKLVNEAQEAIIKQCVRRLSSWLRIAPYQLNSEIQLEEDEDFDTREGIRVMGFAFAPSNENASFAAIIDGDGEVTDYLKLEYFMLKRNDSWATEQEKALREKDKERLKKFILTKKPHVIGVGCDTIVTRYVVEDIKALITELSESDQFPQIGVEFVDSEVSTVYSNSKKALTDFHNYPPFLRQAISLSRRLQDPLIEFSQLCTADEEILCIKYHALQEHLPKDELLTSVYLEFVNRVNEVGVDINRAIVHPHTCQLVQFIGGLGPRKGAYLIRTLKKQQTPLLENRTQLVQNCSIGKTVFINCAAFIRIDTASLSDSGTDTYIEVLDSTRVHPEAYEWARKMAVDALEYDEDNDTNPAQALEEIIENPEKLKDLDLDAFAEELTRQGMGLKTITLYDIRAELSNRYKDQRIPYRSPNLEEVFQLLTGETHDSFYTGKLVMGRVLTVARKKPLSDQLDNANPVRNDETGLWKCPFCAKSDFPELSEVWNHFDAGSCPGQAIGIRVKLDNGLTGLVATKFISDKEVNDPLERVRIGMTIHCRVLKIIVEKFAVDLTCRTSDLMDNNFQFRPTRDKDFYYEAEDKDAKVEEQHKKRQNRQTYIKRIIVHPSFHNIDFKQAEKMLATMDQGEALIRPSSKANDHLTLTWKVHTGVHQHIDIREEGKDNAFSLGHELYINNESYEDLDEIIARYVQPMAGYARDLINYKYFKDVGGKRDEMERIVGEEKKKAPTRIPYFVSASKEFAGKFLLSYQPNLKVIHEFITVTPDGFRYRMNTFRSVSALFKWFKVHFNDRSTFPRTPVTTPVMRTPAGQSSYIGSSATPTIDPQAIRRAAASMPNHVFEALSQVSGQTPSFAGATAAFGASGGHSSMATPYGHSSRPYFGQSTATATPMQSLMTPNMTTPRNYPPTTPGSMPPPTHIPSHQRPGSRTAGAQWSNLAENWNKKSAKPRTPLYATPGASSQMSISPSANTPNVRGDQTPLVDEWN